MLVADVNHLCFMSTYLRIWCWLVTDFGTEKQIFLLNFWIYELLLVCVDINNFQIWVEVDSLILL